MLVGAPQTKKEKIVRAQLVGGGEGEEPARLMTIRKVKWGDDVFEEKPVLRVSKPEDYIDAKDADPRLRKLGEDMEDLEGLAVYIAFQQLHEKKQKDTLAFGSPDIKEACKELYDRVDNFLEKRPEYKRWLDWNVYKQLLAIMAHKSIRCSDGSRCLYEVMSLVRHSWKPNCVWHTNMERYPLGEKKLICMAVDGLNKGVELTVSYVPEESLLKSRDVGLLDLAKELGPTFRMRSCAEQNEESEDMVRCVVEVLVDALATDPPTAEALKTAKESLKDFDVALPFSMVFKARARQRICQMIQILHAQESTQTKATQEAQKAREAQLKEMMELQAKAIKEIDLILGTEAKDSIKQNLDEGLKPIEDESAFLEKYVKKREAKKLAAWQGFYGQLDQKNGS
eukprot:gnl/MRDRNA2_/MRDRNA2_105014_c0_seq1.p1 gnl/MRDRNA2_/MRDRNA2_105014_c0~~gnl/MRDRNA2_/MRDRNA2_105014_c0_seq1.p1  ORF type:complete len:397 (+),score=102.68 gnl/MRDRNA2_/MRDRNA2_105014_c0_seq1:90-1280(+)